MLAPRRLVVAMSLNKPKIRERKVHIPTFTDEINELNEFSLFKNYVSLKSRDAEFTQYLSPLG